MFDPFEDFAEKGYLRNKQGERDLRVVKEVEHALFVVHLPEAQQFSRHGNASSTQRRCESTRSSFRNFIPGRARIGEK